MEALGPQGYTALQLIGVVGERGVRIVPDVSVTGANGGGLVDALLGMMVRNQAGGGADKVVMADEKVAA